MPEAAECRHGDTDGGKAKATASARKHGGGKRPDECSDREQKRDERDRKLINPDDGFTKNRQQDKDSR